MHRQEAVNNRCRPEEALRERHQLLRERLLHCNRREDVNLKLLRLCKRVSNDEWTTLFSRPSSLTSEYWKTGSLVQPCLQARRLRRPIASYISLE